MSKKVTLDLTKVLTNLEGEPLKTPKGLPCNLKFVLTESCLQEIEGERLSGAAKYHLGALAALVQSCDTAEMTTDETAILRRRVGEVFQPLAVKQVWDALDAAEAASTPKLEIAQSIPEDLKR